MKRFLEKSSPSTIGLLQSIGVLIYCALIASFFFTMTKIQPKPGFFGFFLMLLLFVFSAAITGSLVFGYPTYLAVVKNKIIGYILADRLLPYREILHIHSVAISPKYQGHGVALKIYEKIINVAKVNGIESIETGINTDNPNSIRLHQKAGFEVRPWNRADYKIK